MEMTQWIKEDRETECCMCEKDGVLLCDVCSLPVCHIHLEEGDDGLDYCINCYKSEKE